MKPFKLLFLVSCCSILVSCSQSLVYSPSVNLPVRPLKEKEIDLHGGLEMMPETRPEGIGGEKTTFGANGQITYGFSDKFNLGVKGWADMQGRENYFRSGYALTAQFIRPRSECSRMIYVPRTGMVLDGRYIAGYGFSLSALYQREIVENLSYTVGAGALWGFNTISEEEGDKMGIGLQGTASIGWIFTDNFRLGIELTPLYQINLFDHNQQFIFSPQIGVGYTITQKK
ncbi:MAG TPA: hypothetical protein PKC40_12525 [Saprospiraceae bacterium]|nr:hypothetical protein [Saprospiraceae bacterium]